MHTETYLRKITWIIDKNELPVVK